MAHVLAAGSAFAAAGYRKSLISAVKLLELSRTRRQLGDLDDHILKDIGIDRARAEQEAKRPIWDVPASWKSR